MPPIKAIELANFGGVDSRSNPINMPASRWLLCRNWIPRPDGHLELREGYVIRVYNQTGGGAAYSLTPYTMAVPDSYLNPPPPMIAYNPVTGFPPPISQVVPNGTRCGLYWQKSAPSQASAKISSVACTIQAAGTPELAIYKVDSTARFLVGHNVTVSGVVSSASTPANFFNGTFPIEAIGPGTITLLLGISTRGQPRKVPSPAPPPVRPPVQTSPSFAASPSAADFGFIPANVQQTITITLTFTAPSGGTGTLNSYSTYDIDPNGVPIPGPSTKFQISGLPSLPASFTNGQSIAFQVGIDQPAKPAGQGGYPGMLTLNTSAGPVYVSLAATPVAGTLVLSPVAFTFGTQTVGVAAPPQSVSITNQTGASVTLQAPAITVHVGVSGDFYLVNPPTFPYVLANGASLNLQFGATPSIVVTETASVVINTSNSTYPQLSATMSVTGTSVVVPPPGGGGPPPGGGGTPPPPSKYPENFSGTGGTMTAVEVSPGPPMPLLIPFTSAAGSAFLPGTFPMKGMPILSTNRWHYALGKDGYLYMHNGVDAKFFDGVCFRDIGLPTLTPTQVANIGVTIGFEGPNETTVASATPIWNYTGGGFYANQKYTFYYTFFDKATNSLAAAVTPLTGYAISPAQDSANISFTGLPVSTQDPNAIGLVGINVGDGPGGVFLGAQSNNTSALLAFNASMSGSGSAVTVNSNISANSFQSHALSTGDVVIIDQPGGAWHSSGPFAVTVVDPYVFTFQAPAGVDASTYNTPAATFMELMPVPAGATSVTINRVEVPSFQGTGISSDGVVHLPYVEDSAKSLLPASAIGGAQPGYQFYASIYNPITGHVGNRVPIGLRLNNNGNANVIISGLPDFTLPSSEIQSSQGKIPTILLLTSDPEWRILIGRTGDGGEVPYATIDSNGNWITTTAPNQRVINPLQPGQLDSNSELPFANYPPPRSHLKPPTQESFANFWREGDRLCGTLKDSPFVYRSASELDSTTGIYVGDPAQSWDPAKIETFPTAEAIIGGFGYMQESWCFSRNDVGQLSELSGEVSWNGVYNFGIVGPWAFDKGWMSLPYWVSHDRQLCTILPDSNGPISISTEYERTLLSRIGDEYDPLGNLLGYMDKTEVVYFRDPVRLIDCLRIKCVDNSGNPFTIIHDFNLRDDSSPYGQGYEEIYLGPLAIDYEQTYIRDSMAYSRVWAAASDGQIYQFYSGGLDNVDYYDGTIGEAFTADAISLRYLGGERTVARTLEWYGDNNIVWFIYENMLNVDSDSNTWVDVTYEMRPFPGDAQSAHFIADIQRPEMIHAYLWAQLVAHPADAAHPSTPMALNDPPHIPLEEYGRLYLAAPWLGTSRGR